MILIGIEQVAKTFNNMHIAFAVAVHRTNMYEPCKTQSNLIDDVQHTIWNSGREQKRKRRKVLHAACVGHAYHEHIGTDCFCSRLQITKLSSKSIRVG